MDTEYLDKMIQELSDFSSDIEKMLNDKKVNGESKEDSPKKESQLKSLQKLTTFYSSEEEAKEMTEEEDPIVVFIDKRIKEIFGD